MSLRKFHRSRPQRISKACFETLEDRRLLSFSPAASFPVGAHPKAVITGDFNNDGHLDLATANANDGTVSVLLGDGEGGLGAARQFAVGTYPHSLAVADFNNDGNLDLMIKDELAVGVLLGNGDGTFQAPLNVTNDPPFAAAAVGDFNKDGNSDIVVFMNDPEWDYGYALVNVLLGDGHGGFPSYAPYGSLFLTNRQYALSTGDLNGDGNLDVITSLGGGDGAGANSLLGNGDGTFRSSVNPFFTGGDTAVSVGDFTGDGLADLVSVGMDVAIQVGHGDGTFALPISYSANGSTHTSVAATDFNGDGKLDVVTSDADTGTVSLLLGNGNGTLAYVGAFAVGSSPSAVAVGDFNGDGRLDVAAANARSNTVSVLLNDGNWNVLPPPVAPALSISDATVTEGNTGTRNATFTLTLSKPASAEVSVSYNAANITAVAASDFDYKSGIVYIPAGQTSKTFTVAVKGDRLPEPTETFAVNLLTPTNATIADAQGIGTILDDEPRISINNVSKAEGNSKTASFSFTVSLSAAYDQPVTVNYATANGTARAGTDYTARSGSLTFAPGETIKTITIIIKGDKTREANKTFFVELFGSTSNSVITTARGTGTILNDD